MSPTESTAGSAAVNGPLWGARAKDWAEVVEPMHLPLYLAVLERLELPQGASLLDVGCGAGGFCVLAAEHGLDVCGLDAAEGLIGVARARLPGADLRLGELEELPYADRSFDAVTGFNSFQFATRPVRALAEARRVVRDGGRVAMLVWGPAESCQMASIMPVFGSFLPPPPPAAPGPFALSAPGLVESLFAEAGLQPVASGEVDCPFGAADRATAVRGFLSAGVAVRAIEAAGEDAVRDALSKAVAAFERDDGSVRIENVFRFVIGERA